MATQIHPGAFVDPEAQLGEDVEVMPGAVVTKWAQLGDRTVVHPGAVIGGDPQYLAFDRKTPSWVRVGNDSVLREGVTLNRSINENQATVVGARCFFMATSHAGHDCLIADDVVVANGGLLAGHVEVGAFTFIGGGAAVHQFCRLGPLVMIAGGARITFDVPAFCMAAERDQLIGLNLVGIKRRGWDRDTIKEVKSCYQVVIKPVGNMRKSAAELKDTVRTPEGREFLNFFAGGTRGFCRSADRLREGDS
jgi:UDP-N-acetylglucosamine acyltransferase